MAPCIPFTPAGINNTNFNRERIVMFNRNVIALATLSLFPLQSLALDCGNNQSHVSVSGNVTTLNVSETKQVGQICMKLTDEKGREVLDDCGALVGKVVSVDEAGITTLTHTAVFDLQNLFRTEGDTAQPTGYPQECMLPVAEHMSKLTGIGIFNGATIDAWATGSISLCPGQPNTFNLSGEACVRK